MDKDTMFMSLEIHYFAPTLIYRIDTTPTQPAWFYAETDKMILKFI